MKLSALLLLIFFLCLKINSSAQLAVLANPELKSTLEKVLTDFQYDFKDLKGDQLTSNPQTIVYETALKSNLMEDNSITEYSGTHPVYSWQATFLTTEDYEKACDKYKRTYKQLKQISLRITKEGSGFHLYGEYEEPGESSKYISSVFDPVPATALPTKLKVELSMQYEFPNWKVKIAVYRKDREDSEQ
jgi:predicted helicase